ncbi:MAG: 30S ribosome-binding factor RbfA [Deltaproteobacteria bacterium]|nr:30S ribosome-binding factor RbfA [Deltaproteobacteria bacterium]
MLGSKRSLRVGDMILKEISEMLIRGDIRDPRINSVIPTGIKLTDDLGFARVYFTVIDKDIDKVKIMEGLQSASGYIRRELSRRFRIKRIPDLKFEFDETLQEGYRVDELLRKNKRE